MTGRHRVKIHAGVANLVLLLVMNSLIITSGGMANTNLRLFVIVLITVSAVLTVTIVKRLFMKERQLELGSGELVIGERRLEPDGIRAVHIEGYFSPLIGIKPAGRSFVPPSLCFKFVGDSDRALKDLTEWAKENQVQVKKRGFYRWI